MTGQSAGDRRLPRVLRGQGLLTRATGGLRGRRPRAPWPAPSPPRRRREQTSDQAWSCWAWRRLRASAPMSDATISKTTSRAVANLSPTGQLVSAPAVLRVAADAATDFTRRSQRPRIVARALMVAACVIGPLACGGIEVPPSIEGGPGPTSPPNRDGGAHDAVADHRPQGTGGTGGVKSSVGGGGSPVGGQGGRIAGPGRDWRKWRERWQRRRCRRRSTRRSSGCVREGEVRASERPHDRPHGQPQRPRRRHPALLRRWRMAGHRRQQRQLLRRWPAGRDRRRRLRR